MRHPLRVLWLFALAGLVIGGIVGYVRRDTSEAHAAAARTSAWADAHTIAEMAGCVDPRPTPPDPTDDSTSIMGDVNPKESLLCTLDGQPAVINTWPDAGMQASAQLMMQMLLPAFGVEFDYAAGQGWWASLDSDTGDPRQMHAVAQTFADRLGGRIVTISPS